MKFERDHKDKMNWRKVGVVRSCHNREMMKTRYGQKCLICGEPNPNDRGDGGSIPTACPTCKKRYKRDIEDGIFPQGISKNSHTYGSEAWYVFRLIEYELRCGAISEEEAQEMRQSFIDNINEFDQWWRQLNEQHKKQQETFDTSYRDDYLS